MNGLRHACRAVVLGWVSAVFFMVMVTGVSAAEPSPGDVYAARGWQAFERGAFTVAVGHWQQAERAYAQAGSPGARSTVLTQLSHAYQALGHDQKALASLDAALSLAMQARHHRQAAAILGDLGNAYLAMGRLEDAAKWLGEGLQAARDLGDTDLEASILHNTGNLHRARKEPVEALQHYNHSLHLAATAGDHALASRAAVNAAHTALSVEQYAHAKTRLDLAWTHAQQLPPSHDAAYSLISLGEAANALRSHLEAADADLLQRAAEAFTASGRMADAQGNHRAASYAWGYLGQLYESQQRYEEALQLTRRAAFAGQQVQAPESLYRWQWQTGRLLHAMGDLDAAIAAYRRTVTTLQSFRQEIGPVYGRGDASFRQAAEPIYLSLVDLLLTQTASLTEPSQVETYLREARDAMELLKAVELEDYFQDDCVARVSRSELDIVSPLAVVIYPILLPDRLELLVDLPAGLKRFQVPVGAEELTRTVRTLRRFLQKRTTRRYLPPAQTLYNWLIRPLEAALKTANIETLVFVPDGPLRTIPMSALHDGQTFLIERYALATTPGLTLTDPQPLPRANTRVLAAGLSKAVQGFSALPNVPQELSAIGALYGSEPLLDEKYLMSRVQEKLQEEPFSIVHIASHGQFRSNADETFLLTFDGKLSLNQLDDMIGLLRFREEPLELLTLSACQTAVGDDRAALGLAGIAVKAGARSALATLWYISDQASSQLVGLFYKNLQDPSLSRAAALRQAQLQLMQEHRYRHPAYWAPFLLINNWL